MAWTTPKTDWAAGELVTTEDLNAIGENLAAVDGVVLALSGPERGAGGWRSGIQFCWARQGRYGALPQVNRMIPFRAGFANRGEDGGCGIALTQPVAVTGTTNGGRRWTTTHPAMAGGLACLHVLEAATSDAYVITIEGSANGAFSGEESVLATFALDGRALGSELATIDGGDPPLCALGGDTQRVGLGIRSESQFH